MLYQQFTYLDTDWWLLGTVGQIYALDNDSNCLAPWREQGLSEDHLGILDPVVKAIQKDHYAISDLADWSLVLDRGTPFQEKVWQALLDISWGETCSYQGLAQKIGNSQASRAVANAVGSNPIMLLVPCHRVIAKDGSLGGFRGGIQVKERLLAREAEDKE